MMSTGILVLAMVFFALIFDRLNIFLYFIVSSTLHELGHVVMYLLLTAKKPKVKISIFGIKLTDNSLQGNCRLLVLICGPLVNFLLVIACQIILSKHFYLSTYIFMCVNFVIMIFNLLPIRFLDGGQLLSTVVDNYYIETILSVLSLLFMLFIIFAFSSDIYASLCAVSVFIIYFIFNTISGV